MKPPDVALIGQNAVFRQMTLAAQVVNEGCGPPRGGIADQLRPERLQFRLGFARTGTHLTLV
jgi:hypothetical protein